jgi:hypothetical protein
LRGPRLRSAERRGPGTADRRAMLRPIDPRSTLLQFLGEHNDDAAGAANIGQLVDVPVGRHADVAALRSGNTSTRRCVTASINIDLSLITAVPAPDPTASRGHPSVRHHRVARAPHWYPHRKGTGTTPKGKQIRVPQLYRGEANGYRTRAADAEPSDGSHHEAPTFCLVRCRRSWPIRHRSRCERCPQR